MSITLKLSPEAAGDPDALVAVFGRFIGSTVTVSTPERAAQGDVLEVGWNDEHEAYGFTLGENGNDDVATEFVAFNYNTMEVEYA